MSVTFFAKQPEQLPQFKRVGDIIRIHRANIGTYRNFTTFSVNIAYASSWVMFSGFDDSVPPKSMKESPTEDTDGKPGSAIKEYMEH